MAPEIPYSSLNEMEVQLNKLGKGAYSRAVASQLLFCVVQVYVDSLVKMLKVFVALTKGADDLELPFSSVMSHHA